MVSAIGLLLYPNPASPPPTWLVTHHPQAHVKTATLRGLCDKDTVVLAPVRCADGKADWAGVVAAAAESGVRARVLAIGGTTRV
jgi:hypothetical protein